MKKILIFAFASLMIVSVFTSCKDKKDDPTPSESEQKPADETQTASFNIEITDISLFGATVTFTPADESVTYVYGVIAASRFNEDSIKGQYTKEYVDGAIEYYSKQLHREVYYRELFSQGVKTYTYDYLTPETDYVAVALGIDTVSFDVTTPVVTKPFRTLKHEMSGEIAIEVSDINAIGATVTVTPSNFGITYVYSVVPTAEYDESSLETHFTKAFFDNYIQFYAYYGETVYYGDLLYKGKEVRTFNDLTPETDYTVYAVGIDTVSFLMSTPIASKTFRTAKWEKLGEKELSFKDVKFDNQVSGKGWWQLYGYSETIDNAFYYLTVSPMETDNVAGNYTMEDMDLDWTYMVDGTIIGNDTTYNGMISFVDGLFEVKETETGAEMDAIVNGSDGYEYTLHVTGILAVDEDDYNWAPTRRKASARKVTVKRNKAVGIKKLNFPKR